MADLNASNQQQKDQLVAQGTSVQMKTDHGKYYCHIGPPNNQLPPVYKDTPDEAFETAYSNFTKGTGKLGG